MMGSEPSSDTYDAFGQGRVALVTGVNNPLGIGAGVAIALARLRVSVFATYLAQSVEEYGIDPKEAARAVEPGEALYRERNSRGAEEVVSQIRAAGGRIETWEADLADPGVAGALFDRAEAAFGGVDLLVNNAAYSFRDSFLPAERLDGRSTTSTFRVSTLTAEGLDRHWQVNARAPALLMSEFARRHIARGAAWGRIVNVSSDGAPVFPGEVSYGATKYALESLGKSAAAELGPYGITVNTVSLGPIQTGWIGPELAAEVERGTPLGRVGRPEDVADVVAFLCSEQARWVTGQTIFVGGGHRMV
jgi:3-oxoacyl-[acyl-carrier protein] reductase